MSKPATVPTHDTNGTLLTTPPSGILSDGYEPLDKPAAGWFNWLFYWVCQWVAYLQNTYPTFTTIESAYAALAAGERGIVFENDRAESLATGSVGTGGTALAVVTALATSGTHVYYAHGAANPVRVTRATLGTVVTTYTRTNAGSVLRLLFVKDDSVEYIVAAYGQYVEAWNAETGTSLWVYDHGATVRDLAYQDNRLCLVGDAGTGTKHARALVISSGAVSWSYNHGANLLSVAAVSSAFVVAGVATGSASLANMRALAYSTGNDAANEGGTAADTTGVAWDVVQTNVPTSRTLAGDRTGLWWLDAAGKILYAVDVTTGATLGSYALSAALTPYELSIDQELALIGADAGGGVGYALVVDKRSMQPRFRYRVSTGAVQRVISDGAALFLGQLAVSSGGGLRRIYRGNRPTVFFRPVMGSGNADRFALNAGRIVPDQD